jgi:hypothetical protein
MSGKEHSYKIIENNELLKNKLGYTKEQEKALIELMKKPAGAIMTTGKTIDGMSSSAGVSPWEDYLKNTKLKRLTGEENFYQQDDIEKK